MDAAERTRQERLARLLAAPPPDPDPPPRPGFTAAVMAALPPRPDPAPRPASALAGGWWLGVAAAAALAWWLPGELDPVLAMPLAGLEVPWLELLAGSACCIVLVVLGRGRVDREVAV